LAVASSLRLEIGAERRHYNSQIRTLPGSESLSSPDKTLDAEDETGNEEDGDEKELRCCINFGGARLLTSRLARTLAPPKNQIDIILDLRPD
jgi:hypothetical protein